MSLPEQPLNAVELHRLQYVKRWGIVNVNNPQNVAAHSWAVAMLAVGIAQTLCNFLEMGSDAPSIDRVLRAGMFHDASEVFTGDLATPVKNDEILSRQLDGMEGRWMLAVGLSPLLADVSVMEWEIVKLADLAESVKWLTENANISMGHPHIVRDGIVRRLNSRLIDFPEAVHHYLGEYITCGTKGP